MTKHRQPSVIGIAGTRGAGKSTIALLMLRDTLCITEFVNANQIAARLSAFDQFVDLNF